MAFSDSGTLEGPPEMSPWRRCFPPELAWSVPRPTAPAMNATEEVEKELCFLRSHGSRPYGRLHGPGLQLPGSAADEDEAGDDIDDDSADVGPLAHRPGGF
jgi:hypothetical protein